MKKTFIFLLVTILSISFLGGCTSKATRTDTSTAETPTPTEESNTDSNTPAPPQGITVNKIPFEILKLENLSKDKQDIISKLKVGKGFTYWEEDGGYVIAILGGEKATAGYDVIVRSIEDNEGKTVIIVDETAPSGSAATVISYPLVVIKAKGITNNFIISNTKGVRFPNLVINDSSNADKEEKMVTGIYNGRIDTNSIEIRLDNGSLQVFMITEVIESFDDIEEKAKLNLIYYTNEYGQNIVTEIDFAE
jgi:hypothetical protein